MILEQLSARTRVFLLVNHRMGVFERVVKAPPHEEIEANVLRLARAAALLEIPVIFTTSEEGGENGELLPSLQQLLPDAYADWVDRHGIIDSLANPAVVDVLAATGRRQLITAGIGTEVCEVAPALYAHRDGCHVAFVADACGSATALGHDISVRRMAPAGITLTSMASVSSELAGDYYKYSEIMNG